MRSMMRTWLSPYNVKDNRAEIKRGKPRDAKANRDGQFRFGSSVCYLAMSLRLDGGRCLLPTGTNRFRMSEMPRSQVQRISASKFSQITLNSTADMFIGFDCWQGNPENRSVPLRS